MLNKEHLCSCARVVGMLFSMVGHGLLLLSGICAVKIISQEKAYCRARAPCRDVFYSSKRLRVLHGCKSRIVLNQLIYCSIARKYKRLKYVHHFKSARSANIFYLDVYIHKYDYILSCLLTVKEAIFVIRVVAGCNPSSNFKFTHRNRL